MFCKLRDIVYYLYTIHSNKITRLVVLESRLGLESVLEYVFAGLGLGLDSKRLGLGLGLGTIGLGLGTKRTRTCALSEPPILTQAYARLTSCLTCL